MNVRRLSRVATCDLRLATKRFWWYKKAKKFFKLLILMLSTLLNVLYNDFFSIDTDQKEK